MAVVDAALWGLMRPEAPSRFKLPQRLVDSIKDDIESDILQAHREVTAFVEYRETFRDRCDWAFNESTHELRDSGITHAVVLHHAVVAHIARWLRNIGFHVTITPWETEDFSQSGIKLTVTGWVL